MRGTLRATTAALAVAVATGLAGCTDDPKPTTLPSLTPSSPSPTPTGTKGMTDKQQVETLYLDYAVNYQKGERMPKKKRRKFLSQWMVDPALSSYVRGMERFADKNRVSEGHNIPHITSLRVSGEVAHIDDCSDESNVVVKDRTTGEVLGEKGSKNVWYKTTLEKRSKGWRITETWVKEATCSR